MQREREREREVCANHTPLLIVLNDSLRFGENECDSIIICFTAWNDAIQNSKVQQKSQKTKGLGPAIEISFSPQDKIVHREQNYIKRKSTSGCISFYLFALSRILSGPWKDSSLGMPKVTQSLCAVYVFDINQPSLPTPFYSALASVSVFRALSTVFHSIKFPRQLSVFSLCSSGLISALLVLSVSLSVSLSPDTMVCSWLGLKHHLTNDLIMWRETCTNQCIVKSN